MLKNVSSRMPLAGTLDAIQFFLGWFGSHDFKKLRVDCWDETAECFAGGVAEVDWARDGLQLRSDSGRHN